ncbi:FMRFamide receptor [Aphelenchoides fujianensis]|nr:FMRFamide receptor [Aphelenchoides fujianensis]
MNDSEEMAEMSLYHHPGFVALFPDIMAGVPFNGSSTECICPDIQENDYSPLYSWFNYVLIICLLPWLSIFGLLTNVVNVFIFSRKPMSNSANTYLCALACSDFMVIATGVFIFWIDSARSYIKELARAPYLTVYALPLGYMAQTCSIYFTVAAAVDCFVNVCMKTHSPSYCTVQRAKKIVYTISICSIAYNSLRFPQFNLRTCLPEGSQEFVIEICPTTLFFLINSAYNVLMTLLPFFFLLVLNVFIVAQQQAPAEAKTSDADASQLNSARPLANTGEFEGRRPISSASSSLSSFAQSADKAEVAGGGGDSSAITMIMVVVLFLCCNTLALIVNLIETFLDPDPLLLNLLSDASNFLVVFNSSVNALIYFIFDGNYRELFVQYYLQIRRNCCKSRKSHANRPPHLYFKPAAATKREVDVFYPNVAGTYVNVATKKANGQATHPTEHSPVWRAQSIPTSTTATTKLSPLEDSPVRNGGERSGAPPMHSPAQSFVPSIQSEILLMDDDSGWGDAQAASPQPNGNVPRYLAEVQLLEGEEDGGSRPRIVVKPLSGTGEGLTVTPV